MSVIPKTSWSRQDVVIELNSLDGPIPITLSSLCQGVSAFGGLGSGKTSGIGNHLALALMKQGYGILGLCAKADEADRLLKLVKMAGRGKDVVRFRLGGDAHYNFLDSLAQKGADAVVEAFDQISQCIMGKVERNEWVQAGEAHLRNLVKLFLLAGKRVDLSEIRAICDDTKGQEALIDEAQFRVSPEDGENLHTLKMIKLYFLKEWAEKSEKTKTSILMAVSAAMDPLTSGPLHTLFGTDTTVRPEDLRAGKIIIIEIPVLANRSLGTTANIVWKYMVQDMIDAYFGEGQAGPSDATRPVAIVADEYQYFMTTRDTKFASTSRSNRGIQFYMSQNINQLFNRPGTTVTKEVGTLLDCIQGLRVFHQNSCHDTYKWFMDRLGKVWTQKVNQSANFDSAVGEGHGGASVSMQHCDQLSPEDFQVGLASGDAPYKYVVTGLIQQAGVRYKNGKLFAQVAFKQMEEMK